MSKRIGRMIVAVGLLALAGPLMPVRGQVTQPAPAGEFRQGGYPETYQGTFYPGAELRALPVARAQAVVAAAEFRRAQTRLDNEIAEIRRSFLHSPELAAALAEEQEAFDQVNAAREAALSELKNESTYLAAREMKSRLAEQIEQSREQQGVNPAEQLAMAMLKLTHATSVTAMEAAAVAADPKVAQARQRLVAAGKRVSLLNQAFEDAIRSSPAVLAARKAVEDSRIAAVGADALFVEARNVASTAMDYAYHLYDQPLPSIYNAPIYGGFDYPAARVGYPIGYPITYPHSWWSNTPPGR